MCIRDRGEAGTHGGPAGDLYVVVNVREHAIFQRDGKHLYCEVPISFADAALGGELEVPTLDGRVKLKIPEGTQTGKLFRLRGKGVAPVRGGAAGDLMCRVAVETPVNLTKRQRELLEEFRKSLQGDDSHSPKASGWFAVSYTHLDVYKRQEYWCAWRTLGRQRPGRRVRRAHRCWHSLR